MIPRAQYAAKLGSTVYAKSGSIIWRREIAP